MNDHKFTEYDIRDYNLFDNYIEVYMKDDTTVRIDRQEFKGIRYLEYEHIARVLNIQKQKSLII